MRRIKFSVGIRYTDNTQEETFDIKDDVTDEEIWIELQNWADKYIETDWEELNVPNNIV